MSAEVETMMYVREKPWHGQGVCVEEAPTSEDALKLAGLDWTIEAEPVYDKRGNVIPEYVANVRSSDHKVKGIVSTYYRRFQNVSAFAFTDALIGEGCTYETAGSLKDGRKVWLLAKMPERYILGDKFDPYICFTNSHDGTGAIRACMTPIRVVCNNTLNMAFAGAARSWSTPHRGNIEMRVEEARQTLLLANEYMTKLDETADRLANEKLDMGQAQEVLDTMFAVPKDATDRMKKTAEDAKAQIIVCMVRPDLMQFLGTKWGFVNAVSDYVGHGDPVRHTKNYEENRWGTIMTGHPLLDKAMALINA